MKNTFLPFQIGEQYEDWEFDLELLVEERIKGCDSYIYLGDTVFLGKKTQKTELIFSLDILVTVIMDFEFENNTRLKNFLDLINSIILENNKINIYQPKLTL